MVSETARTYAVHMRPAEDEPLTDDMAAKGIQPSKIRRATLTCLRCGKRMEYAQRSSPYESETYAREWDRLAWNGLRDGVTEHDNECPGSDGLERAALSNGRVVFLADGGAA